jgi:hypothetical protein
MAKKRTIRRRFWIELAFGVISEFLFVLAVVVPDWIEVALRVDPDAGDGRLEISIIVAAAAGLVGLLLARMEWRRPVAPAA